jgi:hypothetical protein
MSAPAEINRANAQHSTGPVTELGKQKSSLNALRHGLTSQLVVLPSEDLETYKTHMRNCTAEYKPKTFTETHLVQILADTLWRLNRVAALETNLLTVSVIESTTCPMEEAPEDVQFALTMAAALEKTTKALNNLSLHSQRLHRQLDKTLKTLRELQATRKAAEKAEAAQPAVNKPAPADGFVFTPPQTQPAAPPKPPENRAATAPIPPTM